MFWLHLMAKGHSDGVASLQCKTNNQERVRNNMLFGIGGILGVLWVVGMVYGYRLGGAIYILLAAAILMLFFGLRRWWRQPA
jgi:hypothetical protein